MIAMSNPYIATFPRKYADRASLTPTTSSWNWKGHKVSIARVRNAQSRARVIFIHGVGGHSGALWPLASIVASHGCEVAAVDLPLYGKTCSPEPEAILYELQYQHQCIT